MQPHDIAEHRKRLTFEVKLILSDYWTPDLSAEEQAAKLADWADTLEDWTVDQVRWALIQWRNTEPNRRPNPGHILAMLKRRRGEQHAASVAAQRQQAEAVQPRPPVEDMVRKRKVAEELMGRFRGNREASQ